MSTALGEIDCWNCGHTNTTIYGNAQELVKCEECNEIIALKGIDSLSIATKEDEAKAFREQIEKIKERESCDHPPEMVKPLSLDMNRFPTGCRSASTTSVSVRTTSYICIRCGDEIPTRNIIGDGI